jgi:curved DNA-binding protein CbpA
MEDPYVVLGLPPGASPDEVTAAYRALAKSLHPDRAGNDRRATERMAAVNAAYDAVRETPRPARGNGRRPTRGAHVRPAQGDWLPQRTRAALGRELLSALEQREPIELVAPASTWASPRTLLAVTDRRLLWLLDDAVLNRVRFVRFRDVMDADCKLSWPRRQQATVRLLGRDGRKHSFAGLQPALATRILESVAQARR